MEPIVVHGLVVREVNYGESHKILTLLTQEHGKLSAIQYGVRGAKKPKSAAQLLTYAEYELVKSRDMFRIAQGDTIRSFYSLTQNLETLSCATYLSDLAAWFSPENEDCGDILRLLLNALHVLSEGKKELRLVKAAFELRLMCLCGYLPDLSGCQSCGANPADTLFFLPEAGGILCGTCRGDVLSGERIALDRPVLKAMRYLTTCPDDRVFSFQMSDRALADLATACEAYARVHSGGQIKSLRFLKELLP